MLQVPHGRCPKLLESEKSRNSSNGHFLMWRERGFIWIGSCPAWVGDVASSGEASMAVAEGCVAGWPHLPIQPARVSTWLCQRMRMRSITQSPHPVHIGITGKSETCIIHHWGPSSSRVHSFWSLVFQSGRFEVTSL